MIPPPPTLDYAPPQRTRRPAPRLWIRLLITFTILYLPYYWILWVGTWDNVRIAWLQLWPILPGLWTILLGRTHHELWVMSAATAIIIAIVLFVGRRTRLAFVITSIVALIGSLVNSWLAYQLWLF